MERELRQAIKSKVKNQVMDGLLAGRQGLFASLGLELAGERWIFAYSLTGLCIGYPYFSIPRVILTVMAAYIPPAPTERVTPGAAIIAAPPTPKVSVMALSPMSGLAS